MSRHISKEITAARNGVGTDGIWWVIPRSLSGKKKKKRVVLWNPEWLSLCACVWPGLFLYWSWFWCGHSISQLLKRIDATALFEFNSQHLVFQHASAPPEGSYGKLSFWTFAFINQPKVQWRRSRTVMATASNLHHITFDPHLLSAPG